MSVLEKIIERFPNKPWDFDLLVRNPNISITFIENHPEFPWNLSLFQKQNPNLKESFIKKHPEANWDFNDFSFFPFITTLFIESTIDKPWNFYELSIHPSVDFKLIKDNLDKNWAFEFFCKSNPNINIDIYLMSKIHSPTFPWKKKFLVQNKNFYWKDIVQSDLCEEKQHYANNPNITLNEVLQNPQVPWEWTRISRNVYITLELLQENRDLPWDFYWLSENPKTTWEMVYAFQNKNWDFDYLFRNLPIGDKEIEFFFTLSNSPAKIQMGYSLSRHSISLNNTVLLKYYYKYPFLWMWSEIGYNNQITLDFIIENEYIFDSFDCLSYNLFNWEKEVEQNKLIAYYESFQDICKQRHNVFYQELIQKTWHPSRFMNWCLDIEERKELCEDE